MPRARKYRHKHKPARKTRYKISDDRYVKPHVDTVKYVSFFLMCLFILTWMVTTPA